MSAGTRIAMTVSYRGTHYAGWQRQPNAPTVQAAVEEALSDLLGANVTVVGASRTDAGVHALAQTIHFDVPRDFPLKGLVLGGNGALPRDVRFLSARTVGPDFHAQRSALWKRYRYRLACTRVVDPLRSQFVGAMVLGSATPAAREAASNARPQRDSPRLDVDRMQAAAQSFVGKHDYSAFAKTGGSHTSPVREVFEATLEASDQELTFDFRGEGFLRGMVRAMVGTLVEVGLGQRDVSSVRELLAVGGERSQSGIAAPAEGLLLAAIEYPPGDGGPGDRTFIGS